jgi:hypothetical protein
VPVNDAKLLMAKLAIECTRLALPALPLLHVEDLMEFRDANEPALGAALAASSTLEFRRVNSQKPLSNLACFVRVRTPISSWVLDQRGPGKFARRAISLSSSVRTGSKIRRRLLRGL